MRAVELIEKLALEDNKQKAYYSSVDILLELLYTEGHTEVVDAFRKLDENIL